MSHSPVRIITDSASDILPPYPAELTVLPVTVTFGKTSYSDAVDLSHRAFYEKLIEEEELPTTSQINPDRFYNAFRSAVDAGETVICITLSSKLSGTYQSACIAAEEFPKRVFVVDSLNATIGQGILVRRALELLKTGISAEETATRLDREKHDICLVALVDTLEYLKRGGRLSSSVAFVGTLLSIKPVIAIQDGEVVVLGKARGSKNGNNLLVEKIAEAGGVDFDRPFGLAYSGLGNDTLQKYIADSQELWRGHIEELPISTIGGTIGTHVGPGAVGVAFFSAKESV